MMATKYKIISTMTLKEYKIGNQVYIPQEETMKALLLYGIQEIKKLTTLIKQNGNHRRLFRLLSLFSCRYRQELVLNCIYTNISHYIHGIYGFILHNDPYGVQLYYNIYTPLNKCMGTQTIPDWLWYFYFKVQNGIKWVIKPMALGMPLDYHNLIKNE